MRVHRDLNNFKVKNPVVTIGVFDGVHLGHQKVINHIINTSKAVDGESVIITLWPHPRIVLNKDKEKLTLLNSLSEKEMLLRRFGVDHLIVLPFSKEFSELGSCEFIENYLVHKIKVKHLIVGYNHQFGRNREGSYDFLKQCADKFGFSIEQLNALSIEEDNVSSTKIRNALEKGDVELANSYLGYEYYISGNVIHGEKMGRQLGFPTANIKIDETYKHIPKNGVYGVKVFLNNKVLKGMLNIGSRPTINVNGKSITIEVHILDFGEDIYGQNIKISFLKRIRDEKKFSTLKDLSKQLFDDRITVLQLFNNNDQVS